jgi:diacylglycerol kinase family enzyme
VGIVLAYNPISGRGVGARAAKRLAARLRGDGQDATLIETGPGSKEAPQTVIAEASAMVVVGGDGTVRALAQHAEQAQTPIYHFPYGNENLFAREFAMDRSYDRLLGAITNGRVRHVDVGQCNGGSFLIMASVGLDANVIHRLAEVRRGGVSHLSYVRPVLSEFMRLRGVPMRVLVDGRTVVDGEAGLLIVANSRQYAVRLDPAQRADMTDGKLDVVFFPHEGRLGMSAWAARIAARRHLKNPRLLYEQGEVVEVSGLKSEELRYQVDGDAPGVGAASVAGQASGIGLDLGVRRTVLPVLLPAS